MSFLSCADDQQNRDGPRGGQQNAGASRPLVVCDRRVDDQIAVLQIERGQDVELFVDGARLKDGVFCFRNVRLVLHHIFWEQRGLVGLGVQSDGALSLVEVGLVELEEGVDG